MFFAQALETLVCWGWLTPCSHPLTTVHTHSLLLTPAHTCTHHSHLLTPVHTLTAAYIHHTCSHSLSPAHKSQLSVSLPTPAFGDVTCNLELDSSGSVYTQPSANTVNQA